MRLLTAVHLTIFAAASLTNVFPKIAASSAYSFGGSNMLAAQIAEGAPADVFASADTKLPLQLRANGLCGKPIVFTRNALVIVVPRSNPAHVHSVGDLARHGVKVDAAATGVPVGDYTTKVLAKLHLLSAVSKNIVSREPDVRSVLAKVALGEADAGLVYATDANTVARKVTVIRLPSRAQPTIRYAACVVSTTKHPAAALAFIRGLLAPAGQAKLHMAGFLALP